MVHVITQNEYVQIDKEEMTIIPFDFYEWNNSTVFRGDEVWMSAGYGVASYINGKFTYYNYFDEDSCLTECQNGPFLFHLEDIWLGNQRECKTGGLTNFECYTFLTDNSELPGQRIEAMNVDSGGRMWIGTSQGLQF